MMLKFKKRVREVSLKHSSLSGYISSQQLNKNVQFESSLERDFIYLLEFDPKIKMYLEQPMAIDYIDDTGAKRKYIPDFIVSYQDKFRKTEIIEVKYEYELLKNKRLLEIKHEAARQYCIKNNLLFRVCTDKFIREDKGKRLLNIKFLSYYRDYFSDTANKENSLFYDSSYGHIILEKMRELKETTLINLLDSITANEYKRAEIIFLTWYLIANGFILCDLNKDLTVNSILWSF